jgi:hypothetical protein
MPLCFGEEGVAIVSCHLASLGRGFCNNGHAPAQPLILQQSSSQTYVIFQQKFNGFKSWPVLSIDHKYFL